LLALGIGPVVLNTLTGDVARRLAAVSSLLDVEGADATARFRFPAQGWN
jgi:hypothetical protein